VGSFANSMFSVLFSWVRGSVSWLWTFCTSQENGGLLPWIGENWLALTAVLCVGCMAVDFIIHMLRWRPYKVWASFFRRLFGKNEEEPAPRRRARQQTARIQREYLYADGTARTEDAVQQGDYDEGGMWYQPEDAVPARVSSAEMPQQYVMQFARPESSYAALPNLRYQAELDKAQPLEGLEDYPQPKLAEVELPEPLPLTEERPVTQTERIRKRMAKLNMQSFLNNDEDELNLRYKPAPPAVDKREAYGQPYYPPQWQRPGDVGTSVNRED